jgi:ATP-dependent Clp protease ATP-binding subunit ClpA
MNLDKYTQKSQEALLAAQRLAQDYQHQVVEPIHLLMALVQQQDGIVRAIITKVSGGTQGLQEELSNELDKRPKVQGANQEVGMSRQKFWLPPNVTPRVCRTIMSPPSICCWAWRIAVKANAWFSLV